jgi:hypothetical protein
MRREEVALAAARRARSAEDTSTTMEPETTATESGAVERRRSTAEDFESQTELRTAIHFLQRAPLSPALAAGRRRARSALVSPLFVRGTALVECGEPAGASLRRRLSNARGG